MTIALLYPTQIGGTTAMYFDRACAMLGLDARAWPLGDPAIPRGLPLYIRFDHGDDYDVRPPAWMHPSMFYAIDTHLPHSFKKIARTSTWYDAIACCHRQAVPRLPGASWVPVACDPELHRATGEPRTVDVGFVGTDGGVPRKFLLQALRERWPTSAIGPAQYHEIHSVYSRARIGFNYAIADDVNMRAFEVPACGALLVTNALSRDDFELLGFEDRRHLVLYRTPSQALEAIEHYLAHPAEAEAIAKAGCELVRARHTYAARMRALLDLAADRLGITQLKGQRTTPCAS